MLDAKLSSNPLDRSVDRRDKERGDRGIPYAWKVKLPYMSNAKVEALHWLFNQNKINTNRTNRYLKYQLCRLDRLKNKDTVKF